MRRRERTFAPIDNVLSALNATGYTWRPCADPDKWRAQCPAHDGHAYSLAIRRAEDGTVLLHCFVGCTFGEVLSALGLQPCELWEYAERDHAAKSFRDPGDRGLPGHLRRAMEQLLGRERAA